MKKCEPQDFQYLVIYEEDKVFNNQLPFIIRTMETLKQCSNACFDFLASESFKLSKAQRRMVWDSFGIGASFGHFTFFRVFMVIHKGIRFRPT